MCDRIIVTWWRDWASFKKSSQGEKLHSISSNWTEHLKSNTCKHTCPLNQSGNHKHRTFFPGVIIWKREAIKIQSSVHRFIYFSEKKAFEINNSGITMRVTEQLMIYNHFFFLSASKRLVRSSKSTDSPPTDADPGSWPPATGTDGSSLKRSSSGAEGCWVGTCKMRRVIRIAKSADNGHFLSISPELLAVDKQKGHCLVDLR